MKPLYPRPDYIPADFMFVGQGEHFEHVVGEDYYYVVRRDEFNDCKKCHKAQLDGTSSWRNDCDFYARRPKNEEKKVKYHIIDSKTGNPRWEIHGELGVAAKCPTRELARKVKRALSL